MLRRLGRDTARSKPAPHQIENLLDARANYERKLRLGDLVQAWLRLAGDSGIGDDLTLVGNRGEGTAMQRLESLGVLQRRAKRAGDICGDGIAAEGDAVGMD